MRSYSAIPAPTSPGYRPRAHNTSTTPIPNLLWPMAGGVSSSLWLTHCELQRARDQGFSVRNSVTDMTSGLSKPTGSQMRPCWVAK